MTCYSTDVPTVIRYEYRGCTFSSETKKAENKCGYCVDKLPAEKPWSTGKPKCQGNKGEGQKLRVCFDVLVLIWRVVLLTAYRTELQLAISLFKN